MHVHCYGSTRQCLHHYFIMNTFEQDTEHFTAQFSVFHIHDINVFRANHDINRFFFLKVTVFAVKNDIIEFDLVVLQHHCRNDIAFPDKIGNITVDRLIVDFLRRTYLLNLAVFHNHNRI